jgi:nucleotide-binding universal stress UspA family protein
VFARQLQEERVIKDIVVNLPVEQKHDVAANFAISVARMFEAHLTAVAFAFRPFVPGTLFDGAVADIIQAAYAEAEQAAQAAVSKFEGAARGAGILTESHSLEAGVADAGDRFARIARRFDLSIVCQAAPDAAEPARSIVESALFESGRPVLVVPYIQKDPLKLDRAMVCWDGSRSAARAVGDAMPFLAKTKTVEIITVAGEAAKSNELAGADIAHHLARHKLKVEFERQVVRDIDVANTVLSRAADKGTDFIVMGGYGHSRLREFVMGGATRGILAAMTVPVLMSH